MPLQEPTEKLAPDSLQIHIRLTFVTHSVDFRYTFGFINPHDLTFVIHSNSYSNKFRFQYIFVTHSVSGSHIPHISIDICYTFTTHSGSHSLMIIIFYSDFYSFIHRHFIVQLAICYTLWLDKSKSIITHSLHIRLICLCIWTYQNQSFRQIALYI